MKPVTLSVPKKHLWKVLGKVKSRGKLAEVKLRGDEYLVSVFAKSESHIRQLAKAAGYSKEQMWRILGI